MRRKYQVLHCALTENRSHESEYSKLFILDKREYCARERLLKEKSSKILLERLNCVKDRIEREEEVCIDNLAVCRGVSRFSANR